MKKRLLLICFLLLICLFLNSCANTETDSVETVSVSMIEVKPVFFIDDTETIDKIIDIITNAKIMDKKPINPQGGRVIEFNLFSDNEEKRSFACNSGVLFEYVGDDVIYYQLESTDDYMFIYNYCFR